MSRLPLVTLTACGAGRRFPRPALRRPFFSDRIHNRPHGDDHSAVLGGFALLNEPIFAFIIGVAILAFSLLRLTRSRMKKMKPYDQYIKDIKLKTEKKDDEFGHDVKWVINERKPEGKHTEEP